MANREYKDSAFRMLFTIPQNATALYEWLAHKPLLPDEELIIDEKGGLFTTELNHDVAFRVGDKLIFIIEHQSTDNENMPIRILMAVAELYRRYLKQYGCAIYRHALLPLPAVCPYVFYNGGKNESSEREMKLSAAFGENDNGCLELKVKLININHERNAESMKDCEPLAGYSRFVYYVEQNRETVELGAAIRQAIERCRAEGILTDFFAEHEQEVQVAMVMEYNREDEMAAMHDEGRELGRNEGRETERVSLLKNLMQSLDLSVEKAMAALKIPKSEWAKYAAMV